MLLQLSHSPLYSPLPCTPPQPAFSLFNSCPWVVHISSLASPFPILFLTSPCLFSTYHLCSLFPLPFPYSPLPLPLSADNPPCDLHFCDSVPVLVVCLVCFCFCFQLQLLIVVSLLSQSRISDHSHVELKINKRIISRKFPNMRKWKNILLNNPQAKKKPHVKLENIFIFLILYLKK